MRDKGKGSVRNVLFLCTGNSARSSMAEATLTKIGAPHFAAYSAGSHPKGAVHPETLRLLAELGYDTPRLRSKSWVEFTDGPPFEYIITVCNNAASEVCPIFPGRPAKTHWDIPDPTSVRGSPAEVTSAFRNVHDMLLEQITAFVRQ